MYIFCPVLSARCRGNQVQGRHPHPGEGPEAGAGGHHHGCWAWLQVRTLGRLIALSLLSVLSEAGAGGHHHGHRARLQVRSLGRLVSFVSKEEASPQKQGPSFRLGSLFLSHSVPFVTQFLLSLSFTLVQRSRDLVSSQSLCPKS